jgi:hypothetical protein
MISPFTHTKKEQVKLGLKILKSSGSSAKELYQKARLADTLSSFNVRSKKRRKNFAIMIKERVSRND